MSMLVNEFNGKRESITWLENSYTIGSIHQSYLPRWLAIIYIANAVLMSRPRYGHVTATYKWPFDKWRIGTNNRSYVQNVPVYV